MEGDLARVHLFIEGFVQGVSYRWWVRRRAQDFQLTGWVSNMEDGRVEVVAEGKRSKLVKLTELAKKGPFFAKVKHIDIIWEKATREFEDFEIMK